MKFNRFRCLVCAYRTFWWVSKWTRKLYWLLSCLWQMKQVAYNFELAGFCVRQAAAAAATAIDLSTIGWSGVVGSDVCECDDVFAEFAPEPDAVIKSIGVFMSSIDGVPLYRCARLPNAGDVFIIIGDAAGEFCAINCLLICSWWWSPYVAELLAPIEADEDEAERKLSAILSIFRMSAIFDFRPLASMLRKLFVLPFSSTLGESLPPLPGTALCSICCCCCCCCWFRRHWVW